mmetsp:Transcript_7177/g.15581  ORF Transcript_7177/g.15581 Transcript_7177/m.15581 type:complete len:86 (+) Transcript_7177:449-706(+)
MIAALSFFNISHCGTSSARSVDELATTFKKFFDRFTDARFIFRFWGVASSAEAISTGSQAAEFRDRPVIMLLTKVMASCELLYKF